MSLILELKSISFSFSRTHKILDNLTLSLEEKQIYALMGANGSGKTTLFNILTGFIRPQGGDIIFQSEDISHLAPFKINRKGIGRTFQDLRLITKLTVKENIILAMRNNPTDNWFKAMLPEAFYLNANQKLHAEADKLIEQFFLGDVINSMASEISYGQQKLLTLACCVANGASLLLLDEPVASVQPEYRLKIVSLIKELKEKGKTFLIIEHDVDFIADVADQIFFLRESDVSLFESINALKADKNVMGYFTS